MIRKIVIASLCVSAVGCASTGNSFTPKLQNITTPEISTQNTATLGDYIIMQEKGFLTDAVTLGSANGIYSTITPDTFCRINGNEYYSKNKEAVELKNIYGSSVGHQSNIFYNKEKNEVCVYSNASCYTSKEISIQFKPNTVCAYSESSFKKVIEYNGKAGNVLKFTYREFNGDLIRPAFTTEFTMDMNDDDAVAYKGAIIKIAKASNTQITYTIIKSFN